MSDYISQSLFEIALNIKKIREAKGLNSGELSSKLKKSSGYVTQIERNAINPDHEMLCKMAKFLKVPIQTLLGDAAAPFTICKKGEGVEVIRENPIDIDAGKKFLQYYSLVNNFKHNMMQVLLLEIAPGFTTPNFHFHPGDEFVLMLEGQLEFKCLQDIDSEGRLVWYSKELSMQGNTSSLENSCVWLRAWLPHTYINRSKSKATCLAIYFDPRGDRGTYHQSEKTAVQKKSTKNSQKKENLTATFNEKDHNYYSILHGIGVTLKESRFKANLTVKRLSELTNISKSYISKLERSEVNPSLKIIFTLAEALDIPPISFFSFLENKMFCTCNLTDALNKEVYRSKREHFYQIDEKKLKVFDVLYKMNNGQSMPVLAEGKQLKIVPEFEPQIKPLLLKFYKQEPQTLKLDFHLGQEAVYILDGALDFYCWHGDPSVYKDEEKQNLTIEKFKEFERKNYGKLKLETLRAGDSIYLESKYAHGFVSLSEVTTVIAVHWRYNFVSQIIESKE